MKTILWVAAGGACGAILRYGIQTLTAPGAWPWGTFSVNATGCLTIGVLIGALSGTPWFEGVGRAFLVAGVLGAFTTFSAFSADALLLHEQGRLGAAAGYVVVSVVVCLAAVLIGYRLAGALR